MYNSQTGSVNNNNNNNNNGNLSMSMSMSLMDFGITSQICCDRVHCTDYSNSGNNNGINANANINVNAGHGNNNNMRQVSRPNNFFMLCHDVNTYA